VVAVIDIYCVYVCMAYVMSTVADVARRRNRRRIVTRAPRANDDVSVDTRHSVAFLAGVAVASNVNSSVAMAFGWHQSIYDVAAYSGATIRRIKRPEMTSGMVAGVGGIW